MVEKLKKIDPTLAELIASEIARQQKTLDLIPSECLVPPEVLQVLGSPLVNKYSEGEPGKRYYPGNEYYDKIEKLAQGRAKKVFGAGENWQVNVQCLSGTPANLAVYFGLLNPGDTILGMSLSSGGHLSHGHKVSLSGRIFNSVKYEVGSDGHLDFDQIEKIAEASQPKIIVSGFSAFPHRVDFQRFGEIAKKVGAWHLADISHIAGLVAASQHASPFLHADVVTTTTHKTLNGPRAAIVFAKKKIAEKINRTIFPGLQGGPHNNKIAAIALALKIAQTDEFRTSQHQIVKSAKVLAENLMSLGFKLVGDGTDTHLMLVNLRNKDISGQEAEKLLEKAGILANRNSIPQDKNPYSPSGIRLGTPSITFRGMKEKEVKQIAVWINRVITKKENPQQIREEVEELCQKFPIY